jgi:hypothetical protein
MEMQQYKEKLLQVALQGANIRKVYSWSGGNACCYATERRAVWVKVRIASPQLQEYCSEQLAASACASTSQ